MRNALKRSLSVASSLDVSILSQTPQHPHQDSQVYTQDNHGNNQLKASANRRIQARFQSLAQAGRAAEDEDVVKCSMLTDTRVDYFRAIENALLLENQNLRSHNRFLVDQVRKLHLRQKHLKHQAAAREADLLALRTANHQLEDALQLLAARLTADLAALQLLLAPAPHPHPAARARTFQDIDSAHNEISWSIETMKHLLNKEDDKSEHTQHTRGWSGAAEEETLLEPHMRTALHCAHSMRRKIGDAATNHPILQDLDHRINSIANQIAATTPPKRTPLRNAKTIST